MTPVNPKKKAADPVLKKIPGNAKPGKNNDRKDNDDTIEEDDKLIGDDLEIQLARKDKVDEPASLENEENNY